MRVLWISAVVLVADQLSKLAVLRTMHRHQSIPLIGDWLKFTFTENPGMAFGLEMGPRGMVTVFSVVATALVIWYLYNVRGGYAPYRVSLALILGGALGNIIDRVFYGVLLGYDGFFVGRVVDFIHVDLGYVALPAVLPFVGGTHFALFPIWNVADMAIVVGVVGILFFQKTFHERFLAEHAEPPAEEAKEDAPAHPAEPRAERAGSTAPVNGERADGEAQAAPSYAPGASEEYDASDRASGAS